MPETETQRVPLLVEAAELKMLHETLCFAQSAVLHSPYDESMKLYRSARLGRLIAEIERHRPLGSDGKHGDLHTPTCGCGARPTPAADDGGQG